MVIRLIVLLHFHIQALLAVQLLHDWKISYINKNYDGKHKRRAVGVNNKLPLPIIRGHLGDTLILRIHNAIKDEATGIHSHGIFQNSTNYYDGAAWITECGIAPNTTFEYEIPLMQTGTYWVHGHHGAQSVNGLRGPLIITDPNGEPHMYDEDIILGFEDWFPHEDKMVMGGNSSGHMHGGLSTEAFRSKPADEMYPIALVNGENANNSMPLYFAPGRTYRIRLLNIGSMMMFRFAIEGHSMHVIEVDGVNVERRMVRSVVLGVAQRVSVLVTAKSDMDCNYKYHFDMFTDIFPKHSLMNPYSYSGDIVYSADAPMECWSTMKWEGFDDISLIPLDPLPPLDPDQIKYVDITALKTETHLIQTFINNISFALPSFPSLFTAINSGNMAYQVDTYGESCNACIVDHLKVIELRIRNYDTEIHPMHLHGYTFQIIERGVIGDPDSAVIAGDNPMRRDTVLVPPKEYVHVRFRADNPGVWLFHCHIDKHMSLGLSMMFVTAPDKIRERVNIPDKIFDQCHLLGIDV